MAKQSKTASTTDNAGKEWAGMTPELQAISLIAGIRPYTGADVDKIAAELKLQIASARAGDMGRGQAILVSQAEALNVLFFSLLAKAEKAQDIETKASTFAMAIKTQEGCRSALEGLANISIST